MIFLPRDGTCGDMVKGKKSSREKIKVKKEFERCKREKEGTKNHCSTARLNYFPFFGENRIAWCLHLHFLLTKQSIRLSHYIKYAHVFPIQNESINFLLLFMVLS